MKSRAASLAVVLGLLAGCEAPPRPDAIDGGQDSEVPDDGAEGDAARADMSPLDAGYVRDSGTACGPQPSDYTPRVMMSATDTWPACDPDDGIYRALSSSNVAASRVSSFDRMFLPPYIPDPFGGPTSPFARGQLSGPGRDPSQNDFNNARWQLIYYNFDTLLAAQHDDHQPRPEGTCPADDNTPCICLEFAARNPAYCVGAAALRRELSEGIARGMSTTRPEPSRVYAARIEAVLVWFFYLTIYAHSGACADDVAYCDHAMGHYGGLLSRDAGDGLARIVRSVDPEAHDRMVDAFLALRCWRDLDRATPAATSILQNRARAQLDRALNRAIALVILDRLRRFDLASGPDKQAHLAYLRLLLAPLPAWTLSSREGVIEVPERPSLLDRVLRAASPSDADFVAHEIARPIDVIDTAELAVRINAAIPCD